MHVIRASRPLIGDWKKLCLTIYSLVLSQCGPKVWAQIFLSVCKGEAAIENACMPLHKKLPEELKEVDVIVSFFFQRILQLQQQFSGIPVTSSHVLTSTRSLEVPYSSRFSQSVSFSS